MKGKILISHLILMFSSAAWCGSGSHGGNPINMIDTSDADSFNGKAQVIIQRHDSTGLIQLQGDAAMSLFETLCKEMPQAVVTREQGEFAYDFVGQDVECNRVRNVKAPREGTSGKVQCIILFNKQTGEALKIQNAVEPKSK